MYRPATPDDAHECVRIRGLTRENAISVSRLASLSITAESWADDIRSGELPGFICTVEALGHKRLFLGCSCDPSARSYGFYRHLGWQSTGQMDRHGDEVLELVSP